MEISGSISVVCSLSDNARYNGLLIIMNMLNTVVASYSMQINAKKTKLTKIEDTRVKIKIEKNDLEQVHQFWYLGSRLTEEGSNEEEIMI